MNTVIDLDEEAEVALTTTGDLLHLLRRTRVGMAEVAPALGISRQALDHRAAPGTLDSLSMTANVRRVTGGSM
jgi:hypothetical protein